MDDVRLATADQETAKRKCIKVVVCAIRSSTAVCELIIFIEGP